MWHPFSAETRQQRKLARKQRSARLRKLRHESLESRKLLAAGFVGNVVEVVQTGNDLTLSGNLSNNHVEVHQSKNVGEFVITGKSGTLLDRNGSIVPSTTVNFINGDIIVMLGHGDDTFELTGADDGGKSRVMHDLIIKNNWGSNSNVIEDVSVMRDLKVEKVPGVWGYSALKIVDSIVEGNTIIYNGMQIPEAPVTDPGTGLPDPNEPVMPSGGDSKTLIENSLLKGRQVVSETTGQWEVTALGALTVHNGEGFDIVDVRDTKIGVNTMGDTFIINGDGGSRTTLTSENGLGNTLYGGLGVINGTNLVGVSVYDTLVINKTDVAKTALVVNRDGDSMVVVQDESVLGSSNTLDTMGTGGFNLAGKLIVLNDRGIDEFMMKDSAAPYGVGVINALGMVLSANEVAQITDANAVAFVRDPNILSPIPSLNRNDTMQLYGSRVDVINSDIGTNLKSDGGLVVRGDDKDDVVNVLDSWIGGLRGIDIETFDGNDDVWLFLKGHAVSMISIHTHEGMDEVRLEDVVVTNATMIDLGDGGLDQLELLKATRLQGEANLDGGAGEMDTYAKDIDVVIEDLTLNGFEDLS